MRPDSRSIRLWWVPLALLLLPAVGLVPAHADLPGYFAPIRAWTAERVLMGQIPLLNPWNGCGEPWFANPQTAPLAPPTWPWLLLPAPWALTAEIALHLVWLALGAGTLARRLGADRVTAAAAEAGAFLAPPVLALTGVLNNLETLAWAPWLVLAARSRRPELTLPFAVAGAWFGAAPVLWALLLAVTVATAPRPRRAMIGIALGTGLAAVQIGPFLGWVAGGDRGAAAVPEAMLASGVPLRGWLSLLVPGAAASGWAHTLFLGGAVVAAAACAVRRLPALAAAAAGLAALATLPAAGGGKVYLLVTAGLVRYPARFGVAAALLVLVLALAGLRRWLDGGGPRVTAAAGLATLLLSGRAPAAAAVAGAAALGGMLIAAAVWPERRWVRWTALAATGALFAGLAVGELAPRPAAVLAPRGWAGLAGPERVWAPLPGPADRRFLGRRRDALPLWPAGYWNLLTGIRRVGTEAPVASAAVARLERNASAGPSGRWWIDSAAARWVVLRRPVRSAGLVPRRSRSGLWLHENRRAWPPVVLADGPLAVGGAPSPVPGVVVFRAVGGRVDIRTAAGRPGVVLLSVAPWPGWRWRLDGRPVRARRGPSVVQQIPMPPGAHRLEGRYRDPLLVPGGLISAFSAMTILVLGIARRRGEARP